MPAALLDPALKYLRKQCGLPPKPTTVLDVDPDDPSQRVQSAAEAHAARGVVTDAEPR